MTFSYIFNNIGGLAGWGGKPKTSGATNPKSPGATPATSKKKTTAIVGKMKKFSRKASQYVIKHF